MPAGGIDQRLRLALDAAERAIARARELGMDVCVVVVDAGGRDLVTLRRDGAPWAALAPARAKACTSAAMKLPTAQLSELMGADPVMLRALAASPDLLAVPGGVPLFQHGECVAGLGVAGESYRDDQVIAEYAIALEVVP